jgi:hypothetical protein
MTVRGYIRKKDNDLVTIANQPSDPSPYSEAWFVIEVFFNDVKIATIIPTPTDYTIDQILLEYTTTQDGVYRFKLVFIPTDETELLTIFSKYFLDLSTLTLNKRSDNDTWEPLAETTPIEVEPDHYIERYILIDKTIRTAFYKQMTNSIVAMRSINRVSQPKFVQPYTLLKSAEVLFERGAFSETLQCLEKLSKTLR